MTTLDTEYGPIEVRNDYYGNLEISSVLNRNARVEFSGPTRNSPNANVSLTIRSGYGGFSLEEADLLTGVVEFATALGHQLEAVTEAEREAARRKAEEEARQRQAEQEEENRIVRERTDRLLNEFVGERVKIRARGYKGMPDGTVDAVETISGAYRPVIRWRTNLQRTSNVALWRRLDIYVGNHWETVWDDGDDDLSPWDLPNRSQNAKPTGVLYDAAREGDE